MGRVGERRPGEVTLADHFPGGEVNAWPAWLLTEHLAGAGFVIEDYREQLQRTRFRDIGALVYFLRTVAWAILAFATKPKPGGHLSSLGDQRTRRLP